ncbi:MAG TPA: thioesterase family protein [Candidatus Baltobacteraceae bacterium]|nr:thioesterase family protein [Candidatus Baltobacteraceae bacterium]
MPQFRDSLPPRARTFEARLQVQWADIDIAGIMYFAAYSRFAEYAEMEMFRELGFPYNTVFDELDFWLPRVYVESEYHAPALMGDWMRMRTHLEKVGASSVRWKTVLFNETTGLPSAQVTVTVATMDRTTKKSRPLPPVLRERLLEWCE